MTGARPARRSRPPGAPDAGQVGDPGPGLGGDQLAGGPVPGLKAHLVVGVDPSAGHVAQVERGRAHPADVAHPGQDVGQHPAPGGGASLGPVGEAGGHQGLLAGSTAGFTPIGRPSQRGPAARDGA